MTANFPGARPHGTLQDCEMDVAWQELMAITEMQVAVHNLSHCKDGAASHLGCIIDHTSVRN